MNVDEERLGKDQNYLLDSENRPQEIKAPDLANLIRERTGEIIGVEKFIVDGGANFGGSPVAISLLSQDIKELKSAKYDLMSLLNKIPKLTDISSNDPDGIKEIDIKLNGNAYLLCKGRRQPTDGWDRPKHCNFQCHCFKHY